MESIEHPGIVPLIPNLIDIVHDQDYPLIVNQVGHIMICQPIKLLKKHKFRNIEYI